MNLFKSEAIVITFLSIFTGVLFINTLSNGFTYDDFQVVHGSRFLTSEWRLTGLFNESRVIRTLSLMLDHMMFGIDPKGYHLQNVIWHTLNVILLYLFMLIISGDRKLALIVSLLFSSHPIHVEAVANISNRKDLLALFFMFSSILLYISSYTDIGFRRFLRLSLAFLAFVLALLSKQAAITLPLIVIAYELYFIPKSHKRILLDNMQYLSPIAGLFLIYGIYYLSGPVARFADSQFTYKDLLSLSISSVSYYCRLLLWPANLSAEHSFHIIKTTYFLLSLFFVEMMILLILRTRYSSRLVSFGLLWFALNLLPISPFTANAIVAERYMYIPSVGFAILLGVALRYVSQYQNQAASSLLLVIILFFSLNTIYRNTIWKNDFVLWSDTLKKYPDSVLAKANIAGIYNSTGMHEKAIPIYIDVLRGNPDYPSIRTSLGEAYLGSGRYEEALAEYETILQDIPDFGPSLYGLAELYKVKGQYSDALSSYSKILNLPDHDKKSSPSLKAKVHLQLGLLYSRMGHKKEALEELERSISQYGKISSFIRSEEDLRLAKDEIKRLGNR